MSGEPDELMPKRRLSRKELKDELRWVSLDRDAQRWAKKRLEQKVERLQRRLARAHDRLREDYLGPLA